MRDFTLVLLILVFLCFLTFGYVTKKEEAENLELKLVFCEMKRAEGNSPF